MQKSTSLKYEPSSELLLIIAKRAAFSYEQGAPVEDSPLVTYPPAYKGSRDQRPQNSGRACGAMLILLPRVLRYVRCRKRCYATSAALKCPRRRQFVMSEVPL